MCNTCEQHEHCHNHNEDTTRIYRVISAFAIFIFTVILQISAEVKIVLFVFAYLTAGWDVIYKSFKNILKGDIFDENFLMSIATLGAFAIKEYPEAVMVMVLYQLGEFLQDIAVEKSKRSISELMDIRPDYANVEINGRLVAKDPSQIAVNDHIIVKTGEKIPLDGVVIDGNAIVDSSVLTGESALLQLNKGDVAISGCINTNGILKIRVTKDFGESTVSKILELVEHAGAKKAKTEKFITKFARVYTPLVVVGALLLTILPPLITGDSFSIWFARALTFLVISCPCALVISVPLGFFAGLGGASKCGILIKGSSYLELLSKPEYVVFDKTGTLTHGSFEVTDIVPQKDVTKDELLEYAAMAEFYSSHPIAVSLKSEYGKDIDSSCVKNVEEIAGNGIKADINGITVLAGNSKLMNQFNVVYEPLSNKGTVVYVACNGKYYGYIVIEDKIKSDSQKAIQNFKSINCKTVMLTGDAYGTAKKVSENLGLDIFYAQLSPVEKVKKIEEIIDAKNKNKSVIFVGDGINDAPVLMRSDVGVAMGALGSDAAIEAADAVIMDDKPSKVFTAVKIAENTMNIVKQNIVFAICIKVLFLLLGSIGYITMWGAVFADVGVALIAVMNSLKALNTRCYIKQ